MYYFNRDGKIISTNGFKKFDHGNCAVVYKKDETVLKKYYKDTDAEFRLSPFVFDTLSSYKNEHLFEIYEIYTGVINYLKYLKGTSPFFVEVYTTPFYLEEIIDILSIDKEYLLENFFEIEAMFNELAPLGIEVNDLKRTNSIFQDDRIIIIDVDCFKECHKSVKKIASYNKLCLYDYFREIFVTTLESFYQYDFKFLDRYLLSVCHCLGAQKDVCVTDNIAKLLKNVKKPIDFVKNI